MVRTRQMTRTTYRIRHKTQRLGLVAFLMGSPEGVGSKRHHGIRWRLAPEGLRISSPGLLRSSYPGTMGCGEATLGPWVASLFSQAPFTQPRWGWIFVRSLPRVAASPQPWANIRSPLGAKERTAESTRYAKTGRTAYLSDSEIYFSQE